MQPEAVHPLDAGQVTMLCSIHVQNQSSSARRLRRAVCRTSQGFAGSAGAEIADAENAGATPASARAEIMARRREKPGMVRCFAWGVGGAES